MVAFSGRLWMSGVAALVASGLVASGLIAAPAMAAGGVGSTAAGGTGSMAAGGTGSIAAGGAASVAAGGVGSVANPSFERTASGTPDCWSGRGATATLTFAAAHTGGKAVQLRGRASAADVVEYGSTQTPVCGIPVVPLHAYAIGAWYQATAMVQPIVYTYSLAAGWQRWFAGSPYSGSTPWQKIESMTPAVPAGTELIGLGFATAGNAKLVLDDASVRDATSLLAPIGQGSVFAPSFGTASTLVTNEYAYWNRTRKDAVRSPDWVTTSGSLFASDGGGFTGKIDSGRPDARSAVITNSSIFRLRTINSSFDNVNVGFNLKVAEFGATARTPATAFDGVHIWLRYRSEFSLYSASVARRDGGVVIKKKCPGGPSNDGTYYTLGKAVLGLPVSLGKPSAVSARVQNNPGGTVTITLSVGGRAIVSATDTGVGCAAITAHGAVGIRGDNSRFYFKNFAVSQNTL